MIIGYHITFYKKLIKLIIGYQIGFNEKFIKWLSDSIFPSTRNHISGISIPYCDYKKLRKMIIVYKDAIDKRNIKAIIGFHIAFYKKLRKVIIEYQIDFNKKFIKWLSNTILTSTRNSERGLSDTFFVFLRILMSFSYNQLKLELLT